MRDSRRPQAPSGLRGATPGGTIEALTAPIAMAANREHLGVMQQAIEHGSDQNLIAEYFAPLSTGLGRGQDDKALLVPAADALKDQARLFALQGRVTHLVHEEQGRLEIRFQLAGDLATDLSRPELLDQRIKGGEVRRVATRHGFHP